MTAAAHLPTVYLTPIPYERKYKLMAERFALLMAADDIDIALGVARDIDEMEREAGMVKQQLPTTRTIAGIVSTPRVDANGNQLQSAKCKAVLPLPLLLEHRGWAHPIGEITQCRINDNRVFVRSVVQQGFAGEFVWREIERGRWHSLSAGAELLGNNGAWRLREASIVARPANRDCRFEIYNA